MVPWFTESVRNKALLVLSGGLLTAVIAYFVERWVMDDPASAGLRAGLDALVVLFVGTLIAAALDHRAATLQKQRRAAVRSQLLDLLAPNLKLAATGWVHRRGLSAPEDEDLSVDAGLEALRGKAQELGVAERRLKELHESNELVLSVPWLTSVRSVGTLYWFEGARPSRIRHLLGIRNALQAELHDADDRLRAQFAAFASDLDLADAARLKTDAVVQQELGVASVGTPLDVPSKAREDADAARLLQSVSATAPGDSVLHLVIVADVLERRAHDLRGVSGWTTPFEGMNRCVGALEHEVANVQATLLQLAEFVAVLRRQPGAERSHGAGVERHDRTVDHPAAGI